jgi:hypothetical protein
MKSLKKLAEQLKYLGVKECTLKMGRIDYIALSIKNQNEMREMGIEAVITPVGNQENGNSSFVINGKPERMSYYIVDGVIINYYSDDE